MKTHVHYILPSEQRLDILPTEYFPNRVLIRVDRVATLPCLSDSFSQECISALPLITIETSSNSERMAIKYSPASVAGTSATLEFTSSC